MREARALLVAVAITVVTAIATVPAQAASGPPDPDAPPGAGRQWLPAEAWVMQRWLPFDERRLYTALGATRPGIEAWLADSRGRRTLEHLARRRGIARARLVRRLVAPRRRDVTRRQYERLRARTNRVVTQSHLSQHVLFHTFHLWAVRDAARRTLGISAREWKRLRHRPRGAERGLTVVEIARRRGVPLERLRGPVMASIERSYRRGVRRRDVSRAQVSEQLAEQRWKIELWPLDITKGPPAQRAAHLFCDL